MVAIEKAGLPAVANVCESFVGEAKAVAELGGAPWIRVVNYPSHIDTYGLDQRNEYISELIVPGNIEALTTPIEGGTETVAEAPETEVVFTGTWEEVLDYYFAKMWTDALPVIPPTKERVEAFLRFTDHPPDELLTPPMLQSHRQASVWTVAVNGVMAGCRPEYMPVLVAIVQAMGEPKFRIGNLASTPGWEPQVVLSGPLWKELGFNHAHGVLTAGALSNTSVGRFVKLFARNTTQILPRLGTCMATFGHPWNNILVEDVDFCKEIGWTPLNVMLGFKEDETSVSVMSLTGRIADAGPAASTAADHLAYAVPYFIRNMTPYHVSSEEISKLIGVTPAIAAVLAQEGYSKEDVLQYFFDNARVPASVMEQDFLQYGRGDLAAYGCERGTADPAIFCASDDPNRMLPLVHSIDEMKFIVTGDPGRNRWLLMESNHGQGTWVHKKIELPAKWDALMEKSDLPELVAAAGNFY